MFFKRLARGLRHTETLVSALPIKSRREILAQMIAFSRNLPQQFNQPLPDMMAYLTPDSAANTNNTDPLNLNADVVRSLADAVAAWHLRSPLGICLRRSLLRYHFLREAGLPVGVVFGARLKDSQSGGGIGGHAWLTLHNQPYHENPADYAGFVVMYQYPPDQTR